MSLALKVLCFNVRRCGLLGLRSAASATATSTAGTAEKKTIEPSEELRLTFASPTKAFFTDDVVKQVDVPTMAGMVGLLAKHVPILGVIKPGVVTVFDLEGNTTKKFVSSGSVAMNPDGSCQVLAEEALDIDDIDEAAVKQELDAANQELQQATTDVGKAEATIKKEVCEAMIKAISRS